VKLVKEFFTQMLGGYAAEAIKIFVDERNKRIKELGDEQWIRDLTSFMDVTGHLNTLTEDLQGIRKMSDIIKFFKFMLRSWVDQLKAQNLLHFPHQKIPRNCSLARIQEYSKNIYLAPEELVEQFQNIKIMAL
jgi:hypothetical protein